MSRFKIVSDLDGVLRLLNEPLQKKYGVPAPKDWWWKHEGKNIFDWMKHDKYKIVREEAPKSKFCNLLQKKLKPLEIWTCQPKNWQKHTYKWIDNNLDADTIYILNTEQKRKRLDNNSGHVLIEDSPNFKDYKRIILIDRPYNREAQAKVRVKSVKELKEVIKRLDDGEYLW